METQTLPTIIRRSGQFGPNRVHEVKIGNNAFLVNIVGSGAISLRATVTPSGDLRFPSARADWTIEIGSTGSGKVTEKLGGQHADQGFEASASRHRGFVLARKIFYSLWDYWFDTQFDQTSTAIAVEEAFLSLGCLPKAPVQEAASGN